MDARIGAKILKDIIIGQYYVFFPSIIDLNGRMIFYEDIIPNGWVAMENRKADSIICDPVLVDCPERHISK